MATSTPDTVVSDATLDELAARAEAIYESDLKAQLEPEHNNQFVAVHVDTGDYAVAPTFRQAKRTMLDRHSVDGKLVVMKIGSEPEVNPLVYRMLASDRRTPPQK